MVIRMSIVQIFMEKVYDLMNEAEITNKKAVTEVERATKKSILSMDQF
jgi:hypothetical protein